MVIFRIGVATNFSGVDNVNGILGYATYIFDRLSLSSQLWNPA
jgi:hypothetical protein